MTKQKKSILVSAIFIATALALLLPGLCMSGSLEPSDPPGPTMKTLDEIYSKPIWNMYDMVFVDWPDNPRFAVNNNGTPVDATDDTVLDKETGLVWERNPDSGLQNWFAAHYTCTAQKYYSGRRGWRLPTIQELASLLDMRVADCPHLPSGHPFTNVPCYCHWSATTYAPDASEAWDVLLLTRNVSHYEKAGSDCRVWCVRGGQGVDPQ